jgi:LPS sulfotransferase NodH
MVIDRSLFICFVQRSGSRYLAGLLASTGVAGVPTEAFRSPLERYNRREYEIETDEEYFEWVRRTSVTPNGTFGVNVPYGALQNVLRRLRRADGDGLADVPLLAHAFPSPVFVYLRRRDTVAQAVSWARALQTNRWHSTDPGEREPVYDFDLIAKLVETIRSDEQAWISWFGRNGIDADEILYEDVVADPRREVQRVLAALGLKLPPGVELRPYEGEERLADTLNAEWLERYRADVFEREWFPGARVSR